MPQIFISFIILIITTTRANISDITDLKENNLLPNRLEKNVTNRTKHNSTT